MFKVGKFLSGISQHFRGVDLNEIPAFQMLRMNLQTQRMISSWGCNAYIYWAFLRPWKVNSPLTHRMASTNNECSQIWDDGNIWGKGKAKGENMEWIWDSCSDKYKKDQYHAVSVFFCFWASKWYKYTTKIHKATQQCVEFYPDMWDGHRLEIPPWGSLKSGREGWIKLKRQQTLHWIWINTMKVMGSDLEIRGRERGKRGFTEVCIFSCVPCSMCMHCMFALCGLLY